MSLSDALLPPEELRDQYPALVELSAAVEEHGDDDVDPHLLLHAAAEVSTLVGDQIDEAMDTLMTASSNFNAMTALLNKHHEMTHPGHAAHEGQEGEGV